MVRTEILNLDNWTVTCRDFADPRIKRACSANLQLVQTESKQVLLSWTVAPGPDGRPQQAIQIPTGIMLANGIGLTVGKSAVRRIPVISCEPGRCTAAGAMDDALVHDLAAAEEGRVEMQAIGGNLLQFRMPLRGFDKALAALRR